MSDLALAGKPARARPTRAGDLLQLAQQLQVAREDERSRLAHDLHDELGSLLTSARLHVAGIRQRLPAHSASLMARLQLLDATLQRIGGVQQKVTAGLVPGGLQQLGLVAGLQMLLDDFAVASGLPLRCRLQPVQLSAPASLALYRLVQEGLSNIARHAQASRVGLSLRQGGGWVSLRLSDDGLGFDLAAAPRQRALGLLGMRCRLQALHGTLRVHSSLGHGTCLLARLPAEGANP